ncbi:DUF6551 family protein [Roseateles sp.]|uniref:DUF6551 family protein n=1 Tax=Roseateles sp. TaxID=1971397 RepID=UPI003BA4FB0A
MNTTQKTVRHASKFGTVLVSELNIDPEAQRKLSMAWVKEHIDLFDVDQLGYIVVNRRADGKWYVVDGQHRTELMRAVGWGDQRIHAEMFEGLTQREEAELFNARNDRRAVRKFDHFRISVTAGDERATDITNIVAAAGLIITDQQVDRGITAVDKLEKIYDGGGIASTREGRAALGRTLNAIKHAWGTSPASFNGVLLYGVGLVQLRYNGAIDQKALATKLAPVKGGAPGLLGNARALREMSGRPVHHCIASIVVDIYNKGRRVGKLDDWEAHSTKNANDIAD